MADRSWRQHGADLATRRDDLPSCKRYRVFVPEGTVTPHLRDESRGCSVHAEGKRWVETNLFIDRPQHNVQDRPYELWLAGGHPSGCADRRGDGRTLVQAVSRARELLTL